MTAEDCAALGTARGGIEVLDPMTFFFPDIASYEAGIRLDGLVLVSVKATEGTTYVNPDYARVVGDAGRLRIPVVSYHFLRHGNAAAQARHAVAVVGAGAPLMLDVETASDGSTATIADVNSFVTEYRARRGRVSLLYLPHWYWQQIGSPDLRSFESSGIHLVSSNYTTYSDNGPGWAPYGGVTPLVWQYTDAHPLNGFKVDHNAVRVPLSRFLQMIGGVEMEQTDPVVGAASRGNTVGDVLADASNLRDWWYSAPDARGNNPPPPGSRADLLMKTVIALGQRAPVTLTDAQVQMLIDGLAAKLQPGLSKADVEAAVKDALRTGVGG
jgi:Glycosyl hydrolases family 25